MLGEILFFAVNFLDKIYILTLVTNNIREFRRVEGLCVEDWLA